ncbi:MAG: DUF2147 domain-containing protein [Pseudomonadota bacterium]
MIRPFAKAAVLGATLATLLAAPHAWADASSPVGLWKTIDDDTGKPKSLIRITEVNGEMEGRIEKLIPVPGEDPAPKCDKCEGANKDQPVLGMLILTGMKKDGDEYSGGHILDPHNGKVYKSKLTVIDGGKKLKMRGYIGMPMLGRTQVWLRQE